MADEDVLEGEDAGNKGQAASGVEDIIDMEYLTDSSYRGSIIHGRMEGFGEFTFPTGTKYIGEFRDGVFHGHGTLHFTTGGKFECEWVCGHPAGEEGIGGQYTFKDGLEHQEQDWKYCNMADRRFYSEICKGIKPAGRTQLTDTVPPPKIPLGWFDCGDGVYNPEKRVVYTYEGNHFLRNADTDEHEWIIKTCRKGVTRQEQLSAENGLFE